ncbi:MAG: valine--tRNA ligase [candidate division WOR-3 bacterium]
MKNLSPKYNPSEVEDKIYNFWIEKGYFKADPGSQKPKYSIMIPPPNITGVLTLGHVLNNTIQDIMIRFKRMQGYDTLWQPGIDHAGIATQNVVEKALAREGKTRFDLGREEFVKKVWEWKKQYGETILFQLRKLGVSCDWSRVKFTMDEDLSRAVIRAFVTLYKDGLIYRGNRIINWCPRCGTALADDEVEYEEKRGKLYYIRYPLVNGNGYVTVATTRPETYLGDIAVVVHPEDERYKALVGKKVKLPLVNWFRKDTNGMEFGPEIPVLFSEKVDKEFGTGAVKVTPAHDSVDYEIGEELGLPKIQIMNTQGIMNENAGIFKGLERFEARKRIVELLDKEGFLEKTSDYTHNVGTCYRCHTIIEPYLSLQWFVRMKPLAERAYKAVKEKSITIVPENFEKIYFNWLENVKDWCISRQIWWGHRIPVYTCKDCGNEMVEENTPQSCSKCGSKNIVQDEDVLDTWFSSWLWPLSTLGWPEETEYLKKYYPTDLLVTGWDILFFWVARMIMAGYYFRNEKPFDRVYLHGLIRDEKRRKLSKSLGNSPDPLDLFEKYGADGVRIGLMLITPEGQDIIYSEKKMELGRNFVNKLWNASRLLFLNYEGEPVEGTPEPVKIEDKWILHLLDETIRDVTRALDDLDFNKYTWTLYNFFWGEFCDWYLEAIKPRLARKDRSALVNAFYVLRNVLQLLHPVIPFVTEELWQSLPFKDREESIMVSSWPKSGRFIFNEDYVAFEVLKELIQNVRQIKTELNIQGRLNLAVETHDEKLVHLLYENIELINSLGGVGDLVSHHAGFKGLPIIIRDYHFMLEISDQTQITKMVEDFEREINELEGLLRSVDSKLNNPDFLSKAPQDIVEREKEKRRLFELKITKLRMYLKGLQGVGESN